MFMRVAVDHMAEDIGVGTFLRRLDTKYQYTPAHDECQRKYSFFIACQIINSMGPGCMHPEYESGKWTGIAGYATGGARSEMPDACS